jgi:hypothetical protein
MVEATLDQELIDQIVKKAVDLILEKMIAAAPKQRVLALFAGAGSGYCVGMQSVQWLAKGGHPLTVVLTASARQIIGEDKLRQAGAVRLIGDQEWVNTPKLIREVDLVLVPTLSMNTAAHLAQGLLDSLVTTLVLGSLLAGKPVLAVCDGANPYGNGGRVFGASNDPAPKLRAKLADHLTTLMDFGMQLVPEETFLVNLANQLQGATPPVPPTPSLPAKPGVNGSPLNAAARLGSEMLLTATDLMGYPLGATVRLAAGAKLTPLAREVAERQLLNLVHD